jgi:hypothetical protein
VIVKHNEFWELLTESKQKKAQMKREVVRPQQVRQLANKFEHDPFLLISFQRRIAAECMFSPQKENKFYTK